MVGLALGLLCMGMLRLSAVHPGSLTPLAGLATPGYVLISVAFTIWLVRAGLPLRAMRFGFAVRPNWRQAALALAAIAVLRVFDVALNPLIEDLLGAPRNFERFFDALGSPAALVGLLITNWTLAAFGEEFVYRIVLLRSISFALGDSPRGHAFAVLIQAMIFGLIHAYQGPAGIAGSAFSGLVFGLITISARWSIWPAAFAHGINNTIGILELYRAA